MLDIRMKMDAGHLNTTLGIFGALWHCTEYLAEVQGKGMKRCRTGADALS